MTNRTVPEAWQQGEDTKKVPMESLSELTGFPAGFIKKELLIGEEEVSMEELRKKTIGYLESIDKMFTE